MFEENDVVAERYRLLRQIGAGGMGVVWEAEDLRLDRTVAVKVIIPKLARDKKKLARFETGAKAVASLQSPHIVQLLEYGVDKAPFMVMELLKGSVLSKRLEAGERFDLETAVRIIVQTAKGLTTAHDEGVVHRNLKPGNIFLVEDGEDEYVKVFDFGTAKWLTGFRNANDITTMGAVLGNPDYLAPEQLSGDARSDHRADVWSLAAIAYRIITGVTPFEGEQMGAIMRSILFTNPEPPSSVDAGLPPALDAVFATAFNKKRDERFQSAQLFSDALCDAAGADGATMRISIRTSSSGTPDLGDLAAPDPPATRIEGGVTPSPGSASFDGESLSGEEGASSRGSHTPSGAALVPPGFGRGPGLDLPSRPVLAAGAAVFLVLGGAAGWLVMSPDGSSESRAPATSSSARVTPPQDGSVGSEPSATPPPAPSSEPSPTTTVTTPPTPSASAAPSVSASAEASAAPSVVAPVPVRPWPRPPVDIYED